MEKLYILIGCILCVKAEVLVYNVTEETIPYSFQANLATDSGLYAKHSQETRNKLRFSYFSGDSEIRPYFHVESANSILYLKKKIDREALCPRQKDCVFEYNVLVKPQEHSDLIKVKFNIIDINDVTPNFEDKKCEVEISEGAFVTYSVALPLATDLDSPEFSIVKYEIVPNDPDTFPFRLSQNLRRGSISDVSLILEQRLDRETMEQYLFKYVAADGGMPAKSGTKTCKVIVKDINDNTPVFENSSYVLSIEEDSPVGTTILHVHAKDADSKMNGLVQYAVIQDASKANINVFGVNSTSGALYIKDALDAKTNKDHQLIVKAVDNGQEPLSSTAEILISIKDVNNHAPVIGVTSLSSNRKPSVAEELPPGALVAQVTVTDGDIGKNAIAKCILNDTLNFRLTDSGVNEYRLESVATFDREKKDFYYLLITCSDSSAESKSSSEVTKIHVLDVNDHTPFFIDDPYSAIIKENILQNNPVVSVRAYDKDTEKNSQIMYEITSGNDDGYFTVDIYSGDVFLDKALDFETSKSHTISVIAKDSADIPRSNTTSVLVEVEDVNDNPAKFDTSSFHFNVPENLKGKYTVGPIEAFDRDYEPYNSFTFSINNVENADVNLFEIEENSGLISTSAVFNREEQELYYIEVMTTNTMPPFLTDKTVVVVLITDENDNAPVFGFPTDVNNTVYIGNTSPVGHYVTSVTATDTDKGNNSLLSYSITEGNSNGLFTVDGRSGNVFVSGDLQGFRDTLFTLLIRARDHGEPSLSTEKYLHISVNSSMAPSELQSNPVVGTSIAVILSCIIMVTIIAAFFLVWLYRRNRLPGRNRGNVCRCFPPRKPQKRDCPSGAEVKVKRTDSCIVKQEDEKDQSITSIISSSPSRRTRINRYGESVLAKSVTFDDKLDDTSTGSGTDSGRGTSEEGFCKDVFGMAIDGNQMEVRSFFPVASTPRHSTSFIHISSATRIPASQSSILHHKNPDVQYSTTDPYSSEDLKRHSAPNMECVVSPVYLENGHSFSAGPDRRTTSYNSPNPVFVQPRRTESAAAKRQILRHSAEPSGLLNMSNNIGAKNYANTSHTPCYHNMSDYSNRGSRPSSLKFIDTHIADSDCDSSSTTSGSYRCDEYDPDPEIII